MRFIVDECTGRNVANWLKTQGFEVFSVYEQARGWGDAAILTKANDEGWIIITNDTDFGQKIYRDNYPHKGIILLRLKKERFCNKIEVLSLVIKQYRNQLKNSFIVCTEDKIRLN